MKKERYITWMEYARNHGWWVRIHQKNKKKQISKLFSDGTHGGKYKALKAATRFRDQHLPFIEPRLAHSHSWTNKKSQLPLGVTRTEYWKKSRRKGYVYWYWMEEIHAYYSFKGRQIRKHYNLATHTVKDAVDKAVAFRRAGLRRIKRG